MMDRPAPAERSATSQTLLKDQQFDIEGGAASYPTSTLAFEDSALKPQKQAQPRTWYGKAWRWVCTSENVEAHGVGPLPESLRTDANFFANFTLW